MDQNIRHHCETLEEIVRKMGEAISKHRSDQIVRAILNPPPRPVRHEVTSAGEPSEHMKRWMETHGCD